jgi:ketosteroid isomerase-like protein
MPDRVGKADLVLELIEAWNAGNRERLAAVLAPDAEIRTMRAELEGRPYVGVEGFHQALSDFDEDWDFVRFEADEIRERGDFVALELRLRSKGKASGVELDVPIGWLWEFREDQVVRLQTYSEPPEAFRAAGIEP